MSNGKKYTDSAKLIEKAKLYDSADALNLVCQTAKAKFDETIEVHVRLGVDSRTVPVRLSAPSSSRRATELRPLKRQALILSALRIMSRRSSRKTGSTSTSSSLPRI